VLRLRRILVGVDFSPAAERACALAGAIAVRTGAELLLLHAVDSTLAEAALADGLDLKADALHLVRASETDGVRVHAHVIEGPASRVIVDFALREQADLLVLGSRGLGDDDWPALGATTETVLRCTTIPMLAVPANWVAPPADGPGRPGVGPLIAGLDMTCPAIDASLAACQLAGLIGTSATLLHAVPPPQTPARWRRHADRAAHLILERTTRDLDRVVAAIRAQTRADVTFRIVQGPVARVLTDAARATPGSILVLGRGSRAEEYGPPGSIVSRVLTAGQVPVLIHVTA
jgi:nucleotide-binding universal stress UspA family protein